MLISILFFLSLTSTSNLIFTAGSFEGTYSNFASSMDSAVSGEHPQIEFEIITSEGSMENLDRLYGGEADFGIVQSNDLHYAALHHRRYPYLKNRITAITGLYSEPLHVVVRKDQNIGDIVALSGRRVNLGSIGSGTYFVAQAVLVTADIIDSVDQHTLSIGDCVAALENGEVEAAFFVSSPYVESPISELLNVDIRFELLSLGSDYLQKVRRDLPSLRRMIIPANTYSGQVEAVFTVGAEAVLVCRSEIPSGLVTSVIESIFENRGFLPEHVRQQLDIGFAKKNLPIDLHAGAERYFNEISFFRKHYGKFQLVLFVLILCFMAALQGATRRLRIARLTYIRLVRTLIFFLMVWFTGAYLMFVIEGSINQHFGSIRESFWSIATYLLSGLEDMNPITLAGRAIAFLILAIGIGTVAFITAEVASIFTQSKMRKEVDMQGFKNHVILCNWSERGEKILKELFSPISPLKNIDVGIITDSAQKFSGITEKYGNRVHPISGDPNSTTTLQKAGVPQASAVIILANDEERDPDGASAQVLLALKKLLERENPMDRGPRLMVEVIDSRNRDILEDAGADTIICGEDFAIGTLAQSAIFPGMTKIYEELLDYSGDNNEFYVVPVSAFDSKTAEAVIFGKSYLELAEEIINSRSSDNPAILVGVKKESQVILNPRRQEIVANRLFDRFDEKDSLILMAYEKPEPARLFEMGKGNGQYGNSVHSNSNKVVEEPRDDCRSIEPEEDQILICNWSPVGEKIIEELHDVCSPARSTSILVLSDEVVDDRAYLKKHAFKENVTFLSGRTTNKNVLKKIGAHESKAIIVLAQSSTYDADGANTLTVLALRRLINEELGSTDRKPNILIEAMNHRKREVLISAGAREIISRDDFTMGILAQSCIYPQISDVFNELLDYDDDSNEIYISPWEDIPDQMRPELIGRSFVELHKYFLRNRNPANPSLLVGIVRCEDFMLNPMDSADSSDNRFGSLQEGDGLIFLSYKRPDFSSVGLVQ